jgi:hypothetical protein
MAKTKLTTIEIQNLIAFGKALDMRMKQSRIGFAELSRLTSGTISTGYISDIVRAGRGDSKKYFRLGREKVITLAKALEWDTNEALDVAGFKSDYTQGEESVEEPDTDRAAEAARAAEMIENFLNLSPKLQTQVLAMIRVMQADHPELIQMMRPPIQIVKAEDLTESDVEIYDESEDPSDKDTG